MLPRTTSSTLARTLGLVTSGCPAQQAASTSSRLARSRPLARARAQHFLLPSLLAAPRLRIPARPSPHHSTFSRGYFSSSPPAASSSPSSPISDLTISALHLPSTSSSRSSSPSLHLSISCPSYGIPENSLFSARWCRDSDVSSLSVSQDTGQRIHRSGDVDPDIALKEEASWEVVLPGTKGGGAGEVMEPSLRIFWKGSGMRARPGEEGDVALEASTTDASSLLPLSFLARRSPSHPPTTESHPSLPPVLPWTRASLLDSPSLFLPYADFLSSDATLHAALTQLRTYGIFFIKGVPAKETSAEHCELKTLAGRIGEIRNTFYGEVWDVKALGRKSENVAYTNVDLGLHMDLLYFENPPRLQFLHSLRSLAPGGSSYFVDSYLAATTILSRHPPSASPSSTFHTLTKLPIPYHYNSPSHHLSHSHPLISLSPFHPHQITSTNYSPPFQAPLYTFSAAERVMDAMHEFEVELEREDGRFELRLEEGDCVVFDNRRVLHARREFWESEGKEGEERWLKGCYVDGDVGWDRWRGLEIERERLGREA